MIITAKIAQAQTNQQPLDKKEIKKSIRQLRKIEMKINRKSKKGLDSIDYFYEITSLARKTLLENGYNIINRSSYEWGSWYIITWKTTN